MSFTSEVKKVQHVKYVGLDILYTMQVEDKTLSGTIPILYKEDQNGLRTLEEIGGSAPVIYEDEPDWGSEIENALENEADDLESRNGVIIPQEVWEAWVDDFFDYLQELNLWPKK